jgi:inositol-hexakisphosphate kinase
MRMSTSRGAHDASETALVGEYDVSKLVIQDHVGGKGHVSPGKAQPEHQIEATLASEETAPNPRSRKATQYMGLFRENAPDHKKGKDKTKEASHRRKASVGKDLVLVEEPVSHVADADDEKIASSHPFDGHETRANDNIEDSSAKAIKPKRPSYSRGTSSKSRSRRTSYMLEGGSEHNSPNLTLHYGNDNSANIEWHSGGGGQGTLPLRLLEEIRNHGKAASDQREVAGSRSHRRDTLSQVEAIQYELSSVSDGILARKIHKREPPAGEEDGDEDEEYESDKEQISSATYYPHQGRNLSDENEGEESKILRKSPNKEEFGATEIPEKIFFDAFQKEVIPETVQSAISLQSKSTIHTVQEDFQSSQPLSDLDDLQKSGSAAESSVSDTDYESWDESNNSHSGARSDGKGPGDDDTPTATPKASRNHLEQHANDAPLGSVELQPYKHQVGGHTKVFSFSKQAICKQLNNRENEFYEVIERNHPELLKFMPK